jgi:hypothetical protein
MPQTKGAVDHRPRQRRPKTDLDVTRRHKQAGDDPPHIPSDRSPSIDNCAPYLSPARGGDPKVIPMERNNCASLPRVGVIRPLVTDARPCPRRPPRGVESAHPRVSLSPLSRSWILGQVWGSASPASARNGSRRRGGQLATGR